MFTVGRVCSRLAGCSFDFRPVSGMQLVTLKGVACAQTSVPLRNAIKISCLQKLCKLTILSAVAALAVSLL